MYTERCAHSLAAVYLPSTSGRSCCASIVAMRPCVIPTGFGRPVEPEVCSMMKESCKQVRKSASYRNDWTGCGSSSVSMAGISIIWTVPSSTSFDRAGSGWRSVGLSSVRHSVFSSKDLWASKVFRGDEKSTCHF